MNEKFDYSWKIVLLIVLIAGILLMSLEFHNFNKEGALCKNQPFIYGAKILKASCFCYGEKQGNFMFNESYIGE